MKFSAALRTMMILMIAMNGCTKWELQKNAENYMSSGRNCEAVEEYDKVLKLDPDIMNKESFRANYKISTIECSNTILARAEKYQASGMVVKAIEEFKSSIKVNPDNTKAKELLEVASRQKMENDKKSEEHFIKGMTFYDQKKWSSALSEFNKSISYNNNHPLASIRASSTNKKISEAENLFNEALVDFQKRKWTESISGFEKVLAVSPYHELALENITKARTMIAGVNKSYNDGMMLYNKGLYKEAEKELIKTLENDPYFYNAKEPLVDIYYILAVEYEKRGMIGNALVKFIKA